MAASHISGPSIVYGEGTPGSSGSNSEAGPSSTFQGDSIPDVRFPIDGGVTGKGRVRGYLDSPYICFVDAIPAAASATRIAPAAVATNNALLPMATVLAPGVAPNAPMLPYGASPSNVVRALLIDPGFTTGATTANSNVVVVANAAVLPRLQQGLNVAICGGAGSTWIMATVMQVSGQNVTLSTPMGATVAAAPIALANGSGRNDEAASYITPWLTAGAVAAFDPKSAVTRCVSVTSSNAADTGWAVVVRGYDAAGVALTEVILVTAGGITYGNKGFRYITQCIPSKAGATTTAGTLSVGTSDVFSFAMRSDQWEALNVFYAGSYLTVSTGYKPADTTAPAGQGTGDVCGSIQLGTVGPLGAGAAGGATDGTKRLTMYLSIPLDSLVFARNSNPASLYGVAQFAS